MQTKMIEIRDRGTRIPCIAISTKRDCAQENAFWRCNGFGPDNVILIRCQDQQAKYDPFAWDTTSRTMMEAHLYLEQHFDEVPNYAVIDVRTILGETDTPAVSEIWGGLYG